MWGRGLSGQLGHVDCFPCACAHCSTHPSFVSLCPKLSRFTWGRGLSGQLGHGDCFPCAVPKRVMMGPVHYGPVVRVVRVSVGPTHTAAITADGRLYTWGDGQVCECVRMVGCISAELFDGYCRVVDLLWDARGMHSSSLAKHTHTHTHTHLRTAVTPFCSPTHPSLLPPPSLASLVTASPPPKYTHAHTHLTPPHPLIRSTLPLTVWPARARHNHP